MKRKREDEQLTAFTYGADGKVRWRCVDCGASNPQVSNRCSRCRQKRGASSAGTTGAGDGSGDGNGSLSVAGGQSTSWVEVFDAKSQSIYYWNKETQATTWDRPEELGPAGGVGVATGYYARGGNSLRNVYRTLNEKYLKRPAPKQVDKMPGDKLVARAEGANEFNIWYGKYVGEHWNNKRDHEPADTRCCLELHAGKTRGDGVSCKEGKRTQQFLSLLSPSQLCVHQAFGSDGTGMFCIHFCRGCCARGKDCTYIHRIPMPEDDVRVGLATDCFGRARHKDHRDDMGGVGGFEEDCRTLYVGESNRTLHLLYAFATVALQQAIFTDPVCPSTSLRFLRRYYRKYKAICIRKSCRIQGPFHFWWRKRWR